MYMFYNHAITFQRKVICVMFSLDDEDTILSGSGQSNYSEIAKYMVYVCKFSAVLFKELSQYLYVSFLPSFCICE